MKVRITSVPKQSKARNAKKWKHHEDGGDIDQDYTYPEEAAYGIRMGEEGNIQPISSNPYSDAILRHDGPSHEEGGIKQFQFGNTIETEGGETQFGNTIFGNMTFPKVDGATIPDFTGKKFKNIGKDIAYHENKAQRVATKASALLQGDPTNKFGSLTVNSGIALSDSASQKQRALTEQKELLARIQQGMLDLSNTRGVDPDKMHKEFRKGGFIKAEGGYTYDTHGGRSFDKEKANRLGYDGPDDTKKFQEFLNEKYPDQVKGAGVGSKSGKWDDGIWGKRTDSIVDAALNTHDPNHIDPLPVDGPRMLNTRPQDQMDAMPVNGPKMMPVDIKQDQMKPIPEDQMPKLPNTGRTATSTTRKSLADYNKVSPWDFLSEARYLFDQPDQVTSQQYNPQLMSPYQVSFQDRINRNDAALRAVSQSAPNNIAALSVAAGQNYNANNEVAAEEFRANQGIFNSVMNNNYSLMNEAQKMNIQLNDQQMVRQAQAKAITDTHKAQALKSIADTIDKNRYENMNIRMVEAKHKYTYDPNSNQMVMDNGTQAPFDFSGAGSSGPTGNTTYKYKYNPATGQYEPSEKEVKSQSTASARWGGMFK